MTDQLGEWEGQFQDVLRRIPADRRVRPGALLSAIPSRPNWERFITAVRANWGPWRSQLGRWPACLVVLYGGIAFFEYDERTFWSHFSQAVSGVAVTPSTAEQTEINAAFRNAAQELSLPLILGEGRKDFVGSAVYQAGIPLSLWDAFLEICEWAAWRQDWNSLPGTEWASAIGKLAGGRTRLKNVLIDSRESTAALVKEMLDARDILTRDPGLTVDQLAYATILRPEYFDEVPETAEFLRPQNPDSLFRDTPKLVWQDRRSCISLYLPAVARSRLPAEWRIEGLTQKAAPSPDEMRLDRSAFKKRLMVGLATGNEIEAQAIRGIDGWALFDLEFGGRIVNRAREELPLRSYAVVAQSPLRIKSLEGFVQADNPQNEEVELSDGSKCYVTRLWPTGKFAAIEVANDAHTSALIRFKTRARLESRFFVGRGYRAAFFLRMSDGSIKTDSLPMPCIVIPKGYFRDNHSELKSRFRIFEGEHIAGGEWTAKATNTSDDREFYVWQWSGSPFIEPRKEITHLKSLGDLGAAYRRRDMSGQRTFRVGAADFPVSHTINLIYSLKDIQRFWANLPGSFLPWFLLCQNPAGMTWDDLLLAKEAIAPDLSLSPFLLRRYAKFGFLSQHGQRWRINDCRAVLGLAAKNQFQLMYCGDPSVLWCLYREMHHQLNGKGLPTIEVRDDRAHAPYLSMEWPLRARSRIEPILRESRVSILGNLWTH